MINPLQTQFLLLIILFILTALSAHEPITKIIFYLLPWIEYALILLIVSDQAKDKTAKNLLIIGILSSGLIAALGGIQDFTHYLLLHKGWFYRARYSFESPNLLGNFLLLILPVPLVNFVYSEKKKAIWFLILIPMIVTFVMTLSRGSWIGLFASLIFLLSQTKDKIKLFILPLVPFFLTAVGIVLFLPKEALHRALILPFHKGFDTKLHLAIWESALKMTAHHPLFGVGFGNFTVIYPKYAAPKIGFHYLFIPHANELFLQIAAENGVIGLTIFLWLVWSILNLGIQNLKQARNAYDKNLISAILAAVIGFLIYGLFDYTWWYLKVGVLFWFLVGILTSYSSQQNKLEEKRQSG